MGGCSLYFCSGDQTSYSYTSNLCYCSVYASVLLFVVVTRNHFDCYVTLAVTVFFLLQQIYFNERAVYISHRLVMFSFTLNCILISFIMNKFLFKSTALRTTEKPSPFAFRPLSVAMKRSAGPPVHSQTMMHGSV